MNFEILSRHESGSLFCRPDDYGLTGDGARCVLTCKTSITPRVTFLESAAVVVDAHCVAMSTPLK